MVMDTEIRSKLEGITDEMKKSGFFSENAPLLKSIFGDQPTPFDDPESLATSTVRQAARREDVPERKVDLEQDERAEGEQKEGVIGKVKKMFGKT
ncbi:hypothetical protein HDU93_001397 [Gonapodya sp. JEL0774]|nr:hypothetical protein HDU93_001397 [Gonapodya sp. JEL0774]